MNKPAAPFDRRFQRLENSGTGFSNNWKFPVCSAAWHDIPIRQLMIVRHHYNAAQMENRYAG